MQRGYRAHTLLAKPRADRAAAERLEGREGLRLRRTHAAFGGLRVLETDGHEDVAEVAKRLAASGLYEYVEPDYIRQAAAVPNDLRFADQWGLANTGQSGGTVAADIKATAAWDIQREAGDVIVAVIDSGLFTFHEDIIGNLWQNNAEANGTRGLDDDGNGFIDDVNGINVTVARSSTVSGDPADTSGHGSHVAGIIGATGDNGRGIAGVAWKVKVMALKFMAQKSGSVSGAIACIDYAIAKGAHIINASYGSTTFSQAEYDAIKRARDAGIVVVAAAGNDSDEISSSLHYPAGYQLDNIVTVAATTRQDRMASYSTFGSGLVDLAAPGSSILSLGLANSQTYVLNSGTSMAAPHVTGALALLKQKYPSDNYRALINRVLNSADVLPALGNLVHTGARLNLLRALGTDNRPFNDDFARRASLAGVTNTARASTAFATRETGEPDHGVAAAGGSIWWTWTAPSDAGRISFTTAGSAVDTVLAVYALPAGATLGTLQRIAFNDDGGEGTTSGVIFDGTPGATYAIAVASKGGEGLVMLNVASAPINDTFARALTLAGPSVVVSGNNARATREPDEPRITNSRGQPLGGDHTVWYKWVAPQSRAYQISAAGESMDPVASVYTGGTLAGLARVASDDDGGPGLDSLLRINAVAGVTYYISVDSYSVAGAYTLSIADAAWQYVYEYPYYSTPVLGPDGTIYAGDALGVVHAVRPDGTRKWYGQLPGYLLGGSVAIGTDGRLYAADATGRVYAVGLDDGKARWAYSTGSNIWAALALAADGTVYAKSDDNMLYAINPDGTLKWKTEVRGDTYTAPTIAADGTIYIAAGKDAALYAIAPDGTQKWRAALGADVYCSPAIGADGTIYIGNYEGRFFALRPDSTERWHFDTGALLSSSPVIGTDGTVYFGSYNKKVYALDGATGAKRWEYTTGDIIRSTAPVIADDGTIYIGSDDCFIHALAPDGTLKRTYATTGPILAAPILAAGRLYVASYDAKLYAFDTGNNLARSPWPMHRHNLRRLARVTEIAGIPAFSAQPTAAVSASAGAPVQLSATAAVAGGGAVTYQWLFNDVAIAGATSATLTLSATQGSDAGTYRVIATGPGGSTISTATVVTVAAADTSNARLSNLAVRTTAASGDGALFVGFAVSGPATSADKPLLIRAVGPSLGQFGVTGFLADPILEIYSGSTKQRENNNWGGNADIATVTPKVGAFNLASTTSLDAALYANFAGGSYSAQISGPAGTSGIVLAEIYDATPGDGFTAATPRLVNVSARTFVGTGGNVLIAGFAVSGTSMKRVLVRAIGPTLGTFGVSGALADPRLEIFSSKDGEKPMVTNDNWGTASNADDVVSKSAAVGAFSLLRESKDAVLLLTLEPGTYSAKVSGVNNTTGSALVEVYELP